MFRIVLSLLVLVVGADVAEALPAAYRMSCAETENLVARDGAAVVATSPSTYDRYVEDGRYCYPGQILQPQWTGTRDKAACFVGYTCATPER